MFIVHLLDQLLSMTQLSIYMYLQTADAYKQPERVQRESLSFMKHVLNIICTPHNNSVFRIHNLSFLDDR